MARKRTLRLTWNTRNYVAWYSRSAAEGNGPRYVSMDVTNPAEADRPIRLTMEADEAEALATRLLTRVEQIREYERRDAAQAARRAQGATRLDELMAEQATS